MPLPEEELLREMYLLALQRTREQGLERYEVSNFARSGERCVHNRLYWRGLGWLGLGAGAHGFLPCGGEPNFGRRWWGLRSPPAYMKAVEAGQIPEGGSEEIDFQQATSEELMLSLRTSAGLQRNRFLQRFRFDAVEALKGPLKKLQDERLVEVTEEALRVTEEGVIIVDLIIMQLSRALDRSDTSFSDFRQSPSKGALKTDSGYRYGRFSS